MVVEHPMKGLSLCYHEGRALAWSLVVDCRLNGERHNEAKFFATREAAEAALPEAITRLTAMKTEATRQKRLKDALQVPALPQAPKGSVLFGLLAADWLSEYVRVHKAPSTYLTYKHLLERHLLPVMQTWPVTDEVMAPLRLKQVLRDELRGKGVSLPTRRMCQVTLCAFFKWALTELPAKTLPRNPALGLSIDLRGKTEKKFVQKTPNPMTRVQVEAFLAWIKAHRDPWCYAFFLWLVDEGSRLGEVCALKRDHLDFERGRAHILDNYSAAQRLLEIEDGETDGRGEKDTKTHRSNQYIDLSPRVMEAIEALLADNRRGWMARGRFIKEPQHVFLTATLGPRRPDGLVYRCFRDAVDALGLKGQDGRPFTIHDLRATFATLAILEKGSAWIGWVAMMLGHSSDATLRKHYYKWIRMTEENLLAQDTKK